MTLWFLVGCVVAEGERSWMVEGPISRVEVEARSGNVEIVARQREDAAVNWSGGGLGMEITPELVLDEGVLRIDTRCDGFCGGELSLSIPDFVDVTLTLDAGEAYVMLPEPADVCVDVGAGSVELLVPGGAYEMDLELGAGSFNLEGIWDEEGAANTISGSIGAGSLSISSTGG